MADPVERRPLPDQSARGELVALANRFGDQAIVDAMYSVWPDLNRFRAENERLRYDAMTVYGIVYEQLTAGIVDDHDRIMRATNELAEAGRRFAGAASPLGSLHEDSAEIRRLRAEVERLHKAWQLQQNLLVQDAKDCEALRAENERLRMAPTRMLERIVEASNIVDSDAIAGTRRTLQRIALVLGLEFGLAVASDEILVTCPECKGEKRIDYGTADAWLNTVYEPCDTCKGTGSVPSREQRLAKETE